MSWASSIIIQLCCSTLLCDRWTQLNCPSRRTSNNIWSRFNGVQHLSYCIYCTDLSLLSIFKSYVYRTLVSILSCIVCVLGFSAINLLAPTVAYASFQLSIHRIYFIEFPQFSKKFFHLGSIIRSSCNINSTINKTVRVNYAQGPVISCYFTF